MTKNNDEPLDFSRRFRLHIEATQERDIWARKAMTLLASGKVRAAHSAAAKAEQWGRKVKELEP